MDIGPAWIALIGTIFGGAGLKIAETWLNRKTVDEDMASKFRGELSAEIIALRAAKAESDKRLDEVEKELEDARDKYWKLREEYAKIQAELIMALKGIKENASHAQDRLTEISGGAIDAETTMNSKDDINLNRPGDPPHSKHGA